MTTRNLIIKPFNFWGGFAGILGSIAYLITYFFNLTPFTLYILILIFCSFTLIAGYSFREILSETNVKNHIAHIGFIMGVISMNTIAMASTIEIVMKTNLKDLQEMENTLVLQQLLTTFNLALNFMGDFFLSLGLILFSIAFIKSSFFPNIWGYAGLGLSIIFFISNFFYPWPPTTKEFVEMGPALAIFIISLSLKLATIKIEKNKTYLSKEKTFSALHK